MRKVCILAFTISFSVFISPLSGLAEKVLVIDSPKVSGQSESLQNAQQFWYELGIVLDQQEVLLSPPEPADFFLLKEKEKFDAALRLCEKKNAKSAIWLKTADDLVLGFGLVVTTSTGRLARIVTFDTPVSAASDVALIVKEMLDHSLTFAERSTAAEDGWIPLPNNAAPNTSGAGSPPVVSTQSFPPLGPVVDDEHPGTRKEPPPEPKPQEFITVGIHANFRQGIASFSGPCMWIGGDVGGAVYPFRRLSFRLGFSAQAGPQFQQTEEKILGYRLSPAFGLGVPFRPGNVSIDLFAEVAAVFTDISINAEGFSSLSSKWWAFAPSLGMGIRAPSTKKVMFSFRAAFSAETDGQRIMKNTDPAVEVMKTPIVSLELSMGVVFSFVREKK